MTGYYSEGLAAERLRHCYDLAPERTRQYLQAEMDFVLSRIEPGASVLDLGCGYGRVIPALAAKAGRVTGIDTSRSSLDMAKALLKDIPNAEVREMDAARLLFANDLFDCVLCIQNGISAFHVDQKQLLQEALRVTKPGGSALFSTYAEGFWPQRLEWFKLQAAAGLLGEIDWDNTRDGVIVCRDGFRATTVGPEQFRRLAAGLPATLTLTEVDGSSLFCELRKQS